MNNLDNIKETKEIGTLTKKENENFPQKEDSP